MGWYSRDIDVGFAGQIANNTLKVVDTYAVGSAAGINPGQPVIKGTAAGTAIVPTSDAEAAKVIGIAVHRHKEPQNPYYAQGEAVPVMTMGDIYVAAGAAIKEDDAAAIKLSSGAYIFVPASTAGAIAIEGATFKNDAAVGQITRLRVRK